MESSIIRLGEAAAQALTRHECHVGDDGNVVFEPHATDRFEIDQLVDDLRHGKIEEAVFLRRLEDLNAARTASPAAARRPTEPERGRSAAGGPAAPAQDSREPAAADPAPGTATVSVDPSGGRHVGARQVRMACAAPGAVIRYSLDGSEPTPASPRYTREIDVEVSTVVKARAFVERAAPGPVARVDLTIACHPVEVEPPAGNYDAQVQARLTCKTRPSVIRYTLDGTEPDERSQMFTGEDILIRQKCTLRARAFSSGREPGDVTSRELNVEMPGWKVLEPTDRSDSVAHEVHETKEPGDGWRMLGASVRGRLHAHRASWREDSFALDRQGCWHVVVVGDGAGSSRLSRVGSRLACDGMCEQLKRRLQGHEVPVRASSPEHPEETDLLILRDFLVQAARGAKGSLRHEAAKRGIRMDELATTLLAVAHAPWNGQSLIATLQIGDGAVGLLSDSAGLTALGDPDSGEFSGETRFLTTRDIEDHLEERVRFCIRKDVRAIVVMSDGVADDYYPAVPKLAQLLKEVLGAVSGAQNPGPVLTEWLKYEKKGSSDDRTLALVYRPESP